MAAPAGGGEEGTGLGHLLGIVAQSDLGRIFNRELGRLARETSIRGVQR